MNRATEHLTNESVQDFLDGDLTVDAANTLLAHLEECPPCRERHGALIATDALLTLEPPVARLEESRRSLVGPALAAAVAVIALLVWSPWTERDPAPTPAPTPASRGGTASAVTTRPVLHRLHVAWSRTRSGHESVTHLGVEPGDRSRAGVRRTCRADRSGPLARLSVHQSREKRP